ncbi:hypothetical protein VNO77_07076 [Canavalia gladiata]|uniref:glyoxylate reductase (NADP(+)) n=1 Tax=Canavalia gladiata TaxID=3824 RepID=A0AAN9R0E0_CANGL
MAEQSHNTSDEQILNLPKVLFHGGPGFSSILQPPYSHNFHLLNTSSLPLHQFFATHTHHCSSVAGAGNLFSGDVADMAVALLIDVMMKISVADRCVRKRVPLASWDSLHASKLTGKKVGIVGLGKIGLEVAQRLEVFGCIISYNCRNKKTLVSYPFYSNVVELAANSNVLILCCALNDQTRHIINREVMLALGKGGVIVNVGRGDLIDEKELLQCLMEGEIGGAGLDVFENEPNVSQEFFLLDNVVLSPHLGFSTLESYMGICQLVGRNLEAFFSNKPLITPVL